MAEQTDLLDGLEPPSAPRDVVEAAPEWAELAIEGRRYRWRLDTAEIDRTRWSPEDRVWKRGDPYAEEDGPYRPPGPAFEVEFMSDDQGWRTVRYFDRLVEVWGMVRSEALETYPGSE